MKAVKILSATIILFFGYFYVYILQERSYGYSQLEKKFTSDHLIKICNWTEETSLLECYKSEYLKFLRHSAGPYMAQQAFMLQLTVFNRDYNYHSTIEGKALSMVLNLELANLFIKLTNVDKLTRKRNQIPGFLLANFYRKNILLSYIEQGAKVVEFKNKYQDEIEKSDSLNQRLNLSIKQFKKNSPRFKF